MRIEVNNQIIEIDESEKYIVTIINGNVKITSLEKLDTTLLEVWKDEEN